MMFINDETTKYISKIRNIQLQNAHDHDVYQR